MFKKELDRIHSESSPISTSAIPSKQYRKPSDNPGCVVGSSSLAPVKNLFKAVKNGKKQENRKRLKANTVSSRFLAPRLKEKNKAP